MDLIKLIIRIFWLFVIKFCMYNELFIDKIYKLYFSGKIIFFIFIYKNLKADF
jgi:hypothetical protein